MKRLLLVAVVGCGGSSGAPPAKPVGVPAPARTPDCQSVGDTVARHWTARGKAAQDPGQKKEAETVGPFAAERIIKHCKADGWTADAVDCVIAALEKEHREEMAPSKKASELTTGDEPEKPSATESCLRADQVASLKSSAPPIGYKP